MITNIVSYNFADERVLEEEYYQDVAEQMSKSLGLKDCISTNLAYFYMHQKGCKSIEEACRLYREDYLKRTK